MRETSYPDDDTDAAPLNLGSGDCTFRVPSYVDALSRAHTDQGTVGIQVVQPIFRQYRGEGQSRSHYGCEKREQSFCRRQDNDQVYTRQAEEELGRPEAHSHAQETYRDRCLSNLRYRPELVRAFRQGHLIRSVDQRVTACLNPPAFYVPGCITSSCSDRPRYVRI